MRKKTVSYNKLGIDVLPNDKPVVYRIKTSSGTTNYIGVASRGSVRNRLRQHLQTGKNRIPGSVVEIEQLDGISDARKRESSIIAKIKPKYNKLRSVTSFFEPISFSKAKGREAVKKMVAKK